MTTSTENQQDSGALEAAPTVDASEQQVGVISSAIGHVALTMLVSALMSALVVFLAIKLWVPAGQRIASMDVAEVMQIKQAQATRAAVRTSATDADKQRIYEDIAKFGQDLEAAIVDIQKECDCVLLVRPAVVKGSVDLTETLKARVGLTGASVEQAIKDLRAEPSAAPQPRTGSLGAPQ